MTAPRTFAALVAAVAFMFFAVYGADSARRDFRNYCWGYAFSHGGDARCDLVFAFN